MAPSRKDPVYEGIFSAVAERSSPSKEEAQKEKAFAEGTRKKLQKAFGKKAQLFFVGSTARDTGVRGDKDIDIFAAFPKARTKEQIVKITISTVKRVLPAKWEMHYAEHPYLQGHLGGFKVEVVPCFRIKVNEGIISAVDRTPLHALYLQKHLTQKQKRDVRVLKVLLKAHGIYGAELEVGGFSGLVCEYLILNYRSLANLLAFAAKWKPPVVLDIEDYYDQEYGELIRRFKTPLIIIDFIDRNRNAAAAISTESFLKFIALCKAFSRNPSEKWFHKPEIKFTQMQLLREVARRKLVLLEMCRPRGIVSDILFPQLRKSQSSISKQLALAEFKVLDDFSFANENYAFIAIELDSLAISPIRKLVGPPVEFKEHVEKFLRAHKQKTKGPYRQNGRVVVEVRRKHEKANKLLLQISRSPEKYGIASHFLAPMRNAKVIESNSLLYRLRENRYLQLKLAERYFSRRIG